MLIKQPVCAVFFRSRLVGLYKISVHLYNLVFHVTWFNLRFNWLLFDAGCVAGGLQVNPFIAPNKLAFKTRRWSKVAQFLEDTRGLPLQAELKYSDYCQVHFCDKQVAQVCLCVHAVEPLQAMFLSLETGSHRQRSFVVKGTGFCSLCGFLFFIFF